MDVDWLEDSSRSAAQQQGGAGDPLVTQQFERISTRYSDAGYREGITEGKLSALQAGFDQSFATSVGPSRRLGQLRGRASAVLALLKSTGTDTATSKATEEATRNLTVELNRVRRMDVLAPDVEAEDHARAEHGEEGQAGRDTAMTEEVRDKRAVEDLEAALDSLGSGGEKALPNGSENLRETALLDELERKLGMLEASLWSA